MAVKPLYNPHAGDILTSVFLDEVGMSQNALAKAIEVPANRIHAIVNGRRRVTADTDLRLCRFWDLSEGYFLRLQNAFETLEAKRRLKDVWRIYSLIIILSYRSKTNRTFSVISDA